MIGGILEIEDVRLIYFDDLFNYVLIYLEEKNRIKIILMIYLKEKNRINIYFDDFIF